MLTATYLVLFRDLIVWSETIQYDGNFKADPRLTARVFAGWAAAYSTASMIAARLGLPSDARIDATFTSPSVPT